MRMAFYEALLNPHGSVFDEVVPFDDSTSGFTSLNAAFGGGDFKDALDLFKVKVSWSNKPFELWWSLFASTKFLTFSPHISFATTVAKYIWCFFLMPYWEFGGDSTEQAHGAPLLRTMKNPVDLDGGTGGFPVNGVISLTINMLNSNWWWWQSLPWGFW